MSVHVIVLGGGVGGMSAAHELVERGFRVTVLEKGAIPGGKARSFGVPNTGTGGRRDLPAEHGFRFFPGFYRHLPDTMARIPYGTRTVFDNLVHATEMEILFQNRRGLVVPARFPRSLTDVANVLTASGYLTTQAGLTLDDIQLYCERVWRLLTSCEERRAAELEGRNWWEYIDAEPRSDAYKAYLGQTPRVLVAADPERANTKTVGDILLQLLFNLSDPGVAADRVLNGPTSDVWIGPWLEHLIDRGVDYRCDSKVIAINVSGGRVASVRVREEGGAEYDVVGDHYVAALPVERMADLVTQDLLDIDPTLEGIRFLADDVDWMNGIQFYLLGEPPLAYGHQMYLGSPWALTSLSQAQFWYPDRGGFAQEFGDGTVRTVLSVDVSDWTHTPGLNGKLAKDCTRDEVAAEVLAQIQVNVPIQLGDLHPKTPWAVDQSIIQPIGGGALTNAEPLLVNTTNSWQWRPMAQTRVPNLFLAADYVRTYTNLATMEAANEAARRAVNAIIDATGARAPRCEVWELHEPIWVKPWRAWDLLRFRRGEPWDGVLPDFIEAAANAVLQSAPSIGSPDAYADFIARETVEQGVGTVPPYVQQEVTDLTLEVASALGRGDIARLRQLFVPGAVIVVLEPERSAESWFAALETFYAAGGRIDLDVLRLERLRPVGREVLAEFAVQVDVTGMAPSGPGRARLTFSESKQAVPPGTPGGPWLVNTLDYMRGA